MTYQEADTQRYNKRFIACRTALGRVPTVLEYPRWVIGKWAEFGGFREKVIELGYERTQKEFDKFIGVPDDNG